MAAVVSASSPRLAARSTAVRKSSAPATAQMRRLESVDAVARPTDCRWLLVLPRARAQRLRPPGAARPSFQNVRRRGPPRRTRRRSGPRSWRPAARQASTGRVAAWVVRLDSADRSAALGEVARASGSALRPGASASRWRPPPRRACGSMGSPVLANRESWRAGRVADVEAAPVRGEVARRPARAGSGAADQRGPSRPCRGCDSARQSAIDVSSVHSPAFSRKGPPPTMSSIGLKEPGGLNSSVVPTASPQARPSSAPVARTATSPGTDHSYTLLRDAVAARQREATTAGGRCRRRCACSRRPRRCPRGRAARTQSRRRSSTGPRTTRRR